jgi:hypothetical protein
MSELKNETIGNEGIDGKEYTIDELADHLGDLISKIFKTPTEPDLNDVYSAQLISQSLIAMMPTELKELKESVCQLHESISIIASATKEILNRLCAIENKKRKDD